MIVAQDNYRIMHRMAEDSAYIIERDIELINNQHGKNYDPLYTIEDVERTMNYVSEYPVMEKIVVDDTLSFMLIPNGHLLGSVQILLYLKQNNIEKTLLFTGDIGNSKVHNYYVNKFTPVDHADLVIGESTYGDRPDLKTGQKKEIMISKNYFLLSHNRYAKCMDKSLSQPSQITDFNFSQQ